MMKLRPIVTGMAFFAAITVGSAANAVVIYEWTEGGPGNGVNSPFISHHTAGGPVLADDFRPNRSGFVSRVDWWGSRPFTQNDLWEITFHNDSGAAAPNAEPQAAILSQHFVNTSGLGDADGDGVFEFTASWSPQDLFVTAGTDFWFSVANGNQGWTWADAGGPAPTVGSEQFDGVESRGGGSPHFGPWTQLADQDFAFRIHVSSIPEPSGFALLGIGLAGLSLMRRRSAV